MGNTTSKIDNSNNDEQFLKSHFNYIGGSSSEEENGEVSGEVSGEEENGEVSGEEESGEESEVSGEEENDEVSDEEESGEESGEDSELDSDLLESDSESESEDIDEDISELIKEDRDKKFTDGSFLIPSEAEKLGIFLNLDNMENLSPINYKGSWNLNKNVIPDMFENKDGTKISNSDICLDCLNGESDDEEGSDDGEGSDGETSEVEDSELEVSELEKWEPSLEDFAALLEDKYEDDMKYNIDNGKIDIKIKKINEILNDKTIDKNLALKNLYDNDFFKTKISMRFNPFRNPDTGETESEIIRFGQYVCKLQDQMVKIIKYYGLNEDVAFVSHAVSNEKIIETGETIKSWDTSKSVFMCTDLKIIDGKLNLDDFPSEIENWDDLKLDKSIKPLESRKCKLCPEKLNKGHFVLYSKEGTFNNLGKLIDDGYKYIVIKIEFPGHFVIAVLDNTNPTKNIYFFDPSGSDMNDINNKCDSSKKEINYRDIKLAILCKVFRQKFDLMEKSIDYNFYTINKDNLQLKASDIYCQTWVLYFICLTVIRKLVVEDGDETKINHIDKFIFGNELLINNWYKLEKGNARKLETNYFKSSLLILKNIFGDKKLDKYFLDYILDFRNRFLDFEVLPEIDVVETSLEDSLEDSK